MTDRNEAESGNGPPGVGTVAVIPDLSSRQFSKISDLVYGLCGIRLAAGKEQLVKTRLWRRLRELGLSDFTEYIDLVESSRGRGELTLMIDALTTNKTNFFREPQHFEFLRSQIAARIPSGSSITIWSAGCSSGEEPYSIAISILEELGGQSSPRIRLLGTDISQRVLRHAREARYEQNAVSDVPPDLLRRYFTTIREGERTLYQVTDRVRSMVQFAHLNLFGTWPMRGPFDIIFCRNVMIYFDRPVQQELLSRFRALLRPGGYLLLGHAESLAGRDQGFTYVRPAVYRR